MELLQELLLETTIILAIVEIVSPVASVVLQMPLALHIMVGEDIHIIQLVELSSLKEQLVVVVLV